MPFAAAVVQAQRVDDGAGGQDPLVAWVDEPQGCVLADGGPAVLLDPVQMEGGIPSVSRVLKKDSVFGYTTKEMR